MRMQNCFFMVDSFNPDLPPEQWSLVYEKRTPGSFSYSASWGKYKIVVSGGGGAGSVASTVGSYGVISGSVTDGINGEKKETQRTLYRDEIEILSGTIGAGALESKTNNNSPYVHPGTPGLGYESGTSADGSAYGNNTHGAKVCGGSGGGSSVLYINNNLFFTCKGGNGGSCEAAGSGTRLYGIKGIGGGNGTSGTGAPGGISVTARATYVTGNPGADGYILIYKSNLKPEPV